jgi:hypothetical protein
MGKLASEGHNDQHPKNTPTQVDHSIDRLARGLATGTVSRRKALRMLGAALVGGALASIPGVAWAAKGGNRECVKCCKENFPPGPERGECISAGARGECPVTCDGNGSGECVSDEATCFPESSSGCQCFENRCTVTPTCVCCPPGGPCPCVEADPADPCIIVGGAGCFGPGAVGPATCSLRVCPPGVT